jgi:hypothetical protein
MKQENLKLYKAHKLEWSETSAIKQVVAVDLRQVSDIIKPNQVGIISMWNSLSSTRISTTAYEIIWSQSDKFFVGGCYFHRAFQCN